MTGLCVSIRKACGEEEEIQIGELLAARIGGDDWRWDLANNSHYQSGAHACIFEGDNLVAYMDSEADGSMVQMFSVEGFNAVRYLPALTKMLTDQLREIDPEEWEEDVEVLG